MASSTLRTEEHHALDGPDSQPGVLACVQGGAVPVELFEASLEAAKKGAAQILKFIAGSYGKGLRKQVVSAEEQREGNDAMEEH